MWGTGKAGKKVRNYGGMSEIVKEANRYIVNAKSLLAEKANRINGHYMDVKYVKMAGHTACGGVLYALDRLATKKKGRKSVEFYQLFLSNYDKKLLTDFNNLYDILHLSMGYDGNNDVRVSKLGIEMAKEFIEKIGARLN